MILLKFICYQSISFVFYCFHFISFVSDDFAPGLLTRPHYHDDPKLLGEDGGPWRALPESFPSISPLKVICLLVLIVALSIFVDSITMSNAMECTFLFK